MSEPGQRTRAGRAKAPDPDAPHILVVDDDDRLRKLLKRYLSDNGYRVTTANSVAEADATRSGLRFDLLVVDVMMPGESGVEMTRRIRESSDTPILLLTAMSEPQDRIAGLESGADDYLSKPFEPRELLLRIATILRRSRSLSSAEPAAEVSFGDLVFHPAQELLKRGEKEVRLTSAEADLLRVFAGRPGATISRDELSRRAGIGRTGRAVDVQITRLRRKIEPDPRNPQYLRTVWGEGYVLHTD